MNDGPEMKRVTYVRKRQVLILTHPGAANLTLGRVKLRYLQWVLSSNMFKQLKE